MIVPYNIFEQRRVDAGIGHRLAGEILLLTKEAMHALTQELLGLWPLRKTDVDSYVDDFGEELKLLACLGNFAPKQIVMPAGGVGEVMEQIKTKFRFMLKLQMRDRLMIRFRAEVGQEIAELDFFVKLFRTLFFGEKPPCPPTPEDLGIGPETLLAGIGEVPGELSRSMARCLALQEVPEKERTILALRYMKISNMLLGFLQQYGAEYSGAIQNSDRPGYFNTYRGLLGRMGAVLARHMDRLAFEMHKPSENGEADRDIDGLPDNTLA